MSVLRSIKKGISLGFQPARWLGVENVKSNGKVCADMVKDLVSHEKVQHQHQRQRQKDLMLSKQMSAAELQSRKKLALFFTYFYLLVSLALLGYAGYLGFAKMMVLPACMSVIISFLVLTHSLREFMVYGQIRAKRNRITLQELFGYLKKGFPQ